MQSLSFDFGLDEPEVEAPETGSVIQNKIEGA